MAYLVSGIAEYVKPRICAARELASDQDTSARLPALKRKNAALLFGAAFLL